MPLASSLRRALPVAALFTSYALADTCWYPDGKTVSSDIPCDTSQQYTSCCSSQSFCLSGGLCLTGGVVTRGSCTDKTWGSEACAGFCKTVSTDGEIGITPCSSGVSTNTFVCGLNNDDCKDSSNTFTLSSDTSLVLRPAQIQALVGPALASGISSATSDSTASAAATSSDGGYSIGEVIGAGCGVGLPLLIALGIVSFLLVREKRKPKSVSTRHSAYTHLDDDGKGSIMIRPAPSMLGRSMTKSSYMSDISSKFGSEFGSFKDRRTASPKPLYIPVGAEVQKPPSVHSPVQSIAESQRASHIPSFAERIEGTRVTPHLVDVKDSSSSRHELDSTPSTPKVASERAMSDASTPTLQELERFELAASRMSK